MFVSAIALATPNTTTAGTGSDVLKRNEPLGANARAPAPARVVRLHICCNRVSSFSAIAPKGPEGAIVPGSDPLNSRETSEALPWCDGPCAGRIHGHVLSGSSLGRSVRERG